MWLRCDPREEYAAPVTVCYCGWLRCDALEEYAAPAREAMARYNLSAVYLATDDPAVVSPGPHTHSALPHLCTFPSAHC